MKGDIEGLLAGVEKSIRLMAGKADLLAKGSATPQVMARHYIAVRQLYDRMDEINKTIGDLKRHMAEELIPQAFEREGVSTLTLAEGFRVTISAQVRASTRDMAAGIEWMKQHGYEAIVKETINASTLSALAKDLGSRNEELPDDVFNVYIMNNTSITKTK